MIRKWMVHQGVRPCLYSVLSGRGRWCRRALGWLCALRYRTVPAHQGVSPLPGRGGRSQGAAAVWDSVPVYTGTPGLGRDPVPLYSGMTTGLVVRTIAVVRVYTVARCAVPTTLSFRAPVARALGLHSQGREYAVYTGTESQQGAAPRSWPHWGVPFQLVERMVHQLITHERGRSSELMEPCLNFEL